MLRSIGMSDGGFNKMKRFECALYGARTMMLYAVSKIKKENIIDALRDDMA